MREAARQSLLEFIKSVQEWNDGVRGRFQTTFGSENCGVTLTFGYGYYDRGKVMVERFKFNERDQQFEREDFEVMESEAAVEEYLNATFGRS